MRSRLTEAPCVITTGVDWPQDAPQNLILYTCIRYMGAVDKAQCIETTCRVRVSISRLAAERSHYQYSCNQCTSSKVRVRETNGWLVRTCYQLARCAWGLYSYARLQ